MQASPLLPTKNHQTIIEMNQFLANPKSLTKKEVSNDFLKNLINPQIQTPMREILKQRSARRASRPEDLPHSPLLEMEKRALFSSRNKSPGNMMLNREFSFLKREGSLFSLDQHVSEELQPETPVVQSVIERNAKLISNFKKGINNGSDSSVLQPVVSDVRSGKSVGPTVKARSPGALSGRTGKKEKRYFDGLKKQIEENQLDTIFKIKNDFLISPRQINTNVTQGRAKYDILMVLERMKVVIGHVVILFGLLCLE